MSRFVHILVAGLVAGVCLAGAKPEQVIKVQPPAKIDPTILNWGARAALARGVQYLTHCSTNDYEGWIVPPRRHSRVVGYEDVEIHYKEVEIERPVYEYEYYEVYQRVPGETSMDPATLKKVKKKRIKRQTGTRKVIEHRRDPDGPIVKIHKRPIKEKGGPDEWRFGCLGHNAMAVFAMRRAGVSADDEIVTVVIDNIVNFIDIFGFPDSTWDVAWFTAAFSTIPTEECAELTRQLSSKLLDGQITEGDGRGLWGPVCINRKVLYALIAAETEAAAEYKKCKLESEEKDTGKRRVAFAHAEKRLEKVQKAVRRYSIQGTQFDRVDYLYNKVKTPEEDSVIMAGLPEYIYNQATADLDSTALAVFAIRQAYEKGLLPKETLRPTTEDSEVFPGMPAPDEVSAILARTANAIVRAQKMDGGWDEMNVHQAISDFDGMRNLPGIPADARSFAKLPSKDNILSDLQGYDTLINIGNVVGMGKLFGKFRNEVLGGLRTARSQSETLADRQDNGDVGGYVPPYDVYMYARNTYRRLGSSAGDRRDIWSRIAYRLIMVQTDERLWQYSEYHPELISPSYRERIAMLAPKEYNERGTAAEHDRSKPHVRYTWYRHWDKNLPKFYRFGPRVVPTAMAMLFLAEGARPPVAGECSWPENAKSTLLPHIMRELDKRFGISFTYSVLGQDVRKEVADPLPAIFMTGKDTLALSTSSKEALSLYMDGGGLVIAEVEPDTNGKAFINAVEKLALEAEPGSSVKEIGDRKDIFGELAGKVRIRAVVGNGNRPVAVFMPVNFRARQVNGYVLTGPAAVSAAYELVIRQLDSSLLEDSYPIALEGLGTPDELYRTAVGLLTGKPLPSPEPEMVALPAGDVPEESEAPREEKPVEDEGLAEDETW